MKQAVILAAGEGRRLRPFTVTKPKAMLSIAYKPILGHVIEALALSGIRDIVLIVGYKKEQVYDYIGYGEKFGIKVTYVTQEQQLGAAHALAQAKPVVNDEFLLVPGDKLLDADTLVGFLNVKPDAVLVKRVDDPARYSVVCVEGGLIKSIMEKPEGSCLANTGIYAFSKDVFNYIEDELTLRDLVKKMTSLGKYLNAYEVKGTWLDVVYPWDVLDLNAAILRRVTAGLSGTVEGGVSLQGQVAIGKGTTIRSNSYIVGPVVIGEGCEIGPNVCILPSTSIGDNVVLAPFTEVRNSVIASDVKIGPASIIEDSVIDRGCVIGGRFTACSGEAEVKVDGEHHTVKIGAILGESCELADSITAEPGVIVGNYCRVKSLKLLSGRLPDQGMVV